MTKWSDDDFEDMIAGGMLLFLGLGILFCLVASIFG